MHLNIHSSTMLHSYKKRNEMLPFAVTCMDLENIILGEVSQTSCCITYMWNLKNGKNELTYKIVTDSQT